MITTRFAPSPTGRLHLGHAYSAVLGHARAREAAGNSSSGSRISTTAGAGPSLSTAFSRISTGSASIGTSRCWSSRSAARIMRPRSTVCARRGLAYPCFCTRADIAAALEAPHETPGALSRHLPRTSRRPRPASSPNRIAGGSTPPRRSTSPDSPAGARASSDLRRSGRHRRRHPRPQGRARCLSSRLRRRRCRIAA